MTSLLIPPADRKALLAALRQHGQAFIARFYRHDLLQARTVRGAQIEAVQEFERTIVQPLLRAVGGRLAAFQARGPDIIMDLFPELIELQRDIERTVEHGSNAVRRLATERLHEITRQETEWVTETARKVLKVDPAPALPGKVDRLTEARPFLGDNVERWFEKMLRRPTGDKVRAWVQTGLQRGLTTDEITRVLRQDILQDQQARAVQTLVRTAATHASAVARQESFKGLGVTHWRFVATLDERTSIQCAANDGREFKLGEGPSPPLHPNCRSTAVPVWGEPFGERASIDGPVPADLTFRKWLEGRSIDEQNEVLGKSRATAWRAGKLSFDKMLGRDLEPLTVRELRELDRIPEEEE